MSDQALLERLADGRYHTLPGRRLTLTAPLTLQGGGFRGQEGTVLDFSRAAANGAEGWVNLTEGAVLRDLELVGDESTVSVVLGQGLTGVWVAGLTVSGSARALIELRNCVACFVERCSLSDSTSSVGLNYGVAFVDCTDCTVNKISGATTRHLVSFGELVTGCRDCRGYNLLARSTAAAGLDVHRMSTGCSYHRCVTTGVNLGGSDNSILDSTITPDPASGLAVQFYALAGDLLVQRCTIHDTPDLYDPAPILKWDRAGDEEDGGRIVLRGNSFHTDRIGLLRIRRGTASLLAEGNTFTGEGRVSVRRVDGCWRSVRGTNNTPPLQVIP